MEFQPSRPSTALRRAPLPEARRSAGNSVLRALTSRSPAGAGAPASAEGHLRAALPRQRCGSLRLARPPPALWRRLQDGGGGGGRGRAVRPRGQRRAPEPAAAGRRRPRPGPGQEQRPGPGPPPLRRGVRLWGQAGAARSALRCPAAGGGRGAGPGLAEGTGGSYRVFL